MLNPFDAKRGMRDKDFRYDAGSSRLHELLISEKMADIERKVGTVFVATSTGSPFYKRYGIHGPLLGRTLISLALEKLLPKPIGRASRVISRMLGNNISYRQTGKSNAVYRMLAEMVLFESAIDSLPDVNSNLSLNFAAPSGFTYPMRILTEGGRVSYSYVTMGGKYPPIYSPGDPHV